MNKNRLQNNQCLKNGCLTPNPNFIKQIDLFFLRDFPADIQVLFNKFKSQIVQADVLIQIAQADACASFHYTFLTIPSKINFLQENQ